MSEDKTLVTINNMVSQQTISREQFTDSQVALFEKVYMMADRNPVLDWNVDGHNQDFIAIGNTIEPVKSFCMKVELMADLTRAIVDKQIHVLNEKNIHYTMHVRLIGKDGRGSDGIGACTTGEVDTYASGKRGKASGKAEHFAITRAETRAFKRALETYSGMPFINMVIMDVFGGHEIGKKQPPKERDVTPTKSGDVMRDAVKMISEAERTGKVGPEYREAVYKEFFERVNKDLHNGQG